MGLVNPRDNLQGLDMLSGRWNIARRWDLLGLGTHPVYPTCRNIPVSLGLVFILGMAPRFNMEMAVNKLLQHNKILCPEVTVI
jgi:hypothetical protein